MSVTYLNSNKTMSTVGMLKKLCYPSWKERKPLSNDATELNTFWCGNTSKSGCRYNLAFVLSYDQHHIILPDNNFTPTNIFMYINGDYAGLILPKELPTLSNSGVLNIGERYNIAYSNPSLSQLKSTMDITMIYRNNTTSFIIGNGLYTNNPISFLLSNMDIKSPDGSYIINKNIDISNYDISVQV